MIGDPASRVICDRCNQVALAYSMSYFNTDIICWDCEQKEKSHPAYGVARALEELAVSLGDRNYPGVGKPPDL